MKRLLAILLAALWPATAAWAQLEPPNDMGVSFGHLHLSVRNVEATKKFYEMFGGTSLKIDGTEVLKFPGVFIFLSPGNPPPSGALRTQVFCGCPDDGIDTSVINHTGFNLREYDKMMAAFKAAGYRMEKFRGQDGRIFLFSPDDLQFEVAGSRNLTAPAGEMHLHVFAPNTPPPGRDHMVPAWEMFMWYAKMLGAKIQVGQPGSGMTSTFPGLAFRIAQTAVQTQPTKGRGVDHIGFEVNNLEAFCKKLEGFGIKFDQPYSTTRHDGFASAEFTDPWGISIELTEGLRKY